MDSRSAVPRLLIVAALLALWSGAALGRLAYLQLFRYSDFLARAERQQQRVVQISPTRADLLDRSGNVLAMTAPVDSCFAVPPEIGDPHDAARRLARILRVSPEPIERRLASSRSFVWVARKLEPETADRIRALDLPGVYFQKEDERFYPKRTLAAPVLGYVDIDGKGLGGIEYELDERIRSKPGRLLVMSDARQRRYLSSGERPEAGSSAVLTIDEKIQFVAEKELAAVIRESHARSGSIIVQDPSSGQILAMASWPTFDPNDPADSPPESRMNRAVSALYEPGSTFKIVTVSAALDQGLTQPDEIIDCQMGAIYIGGHRIRDHKPFGLLTVSEVLANSSGVGTIKLGLRMGAPKLEEYIRAYGFGSPTGIDLPGESRGLLRRVENWTPISVGSIAMGQEVGVTPLQMINAVSAVANGGLLYEPRIVLALRNGDTEEQPPAPAPRRVIRETTAATMRAMLEGVVREGTGRRARLDGYTAGGKTGTAQKVDPATGRYSQTDYIASFVGFAPINDPAITVLVQIDSPRGHHEGGVVAAPVFKRVAEQALAYLGVPRDVPLLPRASAEALRDEDLADLADFDPVETAGAAPDAEGAGVSFEAATAQPATTAATVAVPIGARLPVPNLAGKTVREVTEICARLGLRPVLLGSGVVETQEPEPGALVRRGGTLTVRFGRAPAAKRAPGSRRDNADRGGLFGGAS